MKTTMKLLLTIMLLAAGRMRAADLEYMPALYLLGGVDVQVLTNQDATNYFNRDAQFGPVGLPSGVAHLGMQFGRWMALEVSAEAGPVRDFDVTYENGPFGTTRRVTTQWALTTYSITPGIAWAGSTYVNMLGLRLGQANLFGTVRDSQFGGEGTYESRAQAYDLGVIFRTSGIALGHLSLGLEAGYDWTMFNNISNSNGSGTYGPPHSPERNVSGFAHNGDQTVLDFSGAHVAIVVGFWTNPPAVREGSGLGMED